MLMMCLYFFFFQAEDGIRDKLVTGVQTCALPICISRSSRLWPGRRGAARAGLRRGRLCCSHREEIGRASGRERGEILVGAGSLKKKKYEYATPTTDLNRNRQYI